jgi:protocatechuate 3,4-dioxygenase beta subunit
MLGHLVLHAAALILLGQSSTTVPAKTNEKVPPLCAVSGRVLSSAEGNPLKSARVVLVPEQRGDSWRERQVYSAVSDSDGGFTIKNVPAGRYEFFAKHTGYVDQHYQSEASERGAVLAFQPGQEIKDVIFKMTLAAVITGKVNDEDGEPMAGIQVVALHRPTEDELEENRWRSRHQELSPVAQAQTDDRGQYRLYGLRPGEYYIRAVDEFVPPMMVIQSGDEWELHQSLGSQYAPVYYPGVTQVSQAEAVPVTAGEEAQVDFSMVHTKTVDISGRVIGIDGKPTSDAYVVLEDSPAPDFSIPRNATPNEKGEFTLKGVSPGTYLLMAEQQSSMPDESGYRARQKIEVGTDNIDSITLALGRGVRVSGRISAFSGVVHFERLFVDLASRDDEVPGGWARVKKDGTFEMLDVPDGNFTLNVSGLEEGWYMKSARVGADDILNDGLQVEKGEGAGTIQVLVSNSTAQLEGSVKQDDKPLVGARVRLTPDPETPYNRVRGRSTSTDQSGHFSFVGIAPGQYKVIAKTAVAQGAKPAVSDSQAVSVSEHDHKSIELTVVPPQMP